VQKMSLTELLRTVLEQIDRLREENEEYQGIVADLQDQVGALMRERQGLQAEVKRLVPYELKV
jgi:tRNA nucleotidyltransferase (CCA-adding enzyme)